MAQSAIDALPWSGTDGDKWLASPPRALLNLDAFSSLYSTSGPCIYLENSALRVQRSKCVDDLIFKRGKKSVWSRSNTLHLFHQRELFSNFFKHFLFRNVPHCTHCLHPDKSVLLISSGRGSSVRRDIIGLFKREVGKYINGSPTSCHPSSIPHGTVESSDHGPTEMTCFQTHGRTQLSFSPKRIGVDSSV